MKIRQKQKSSHFINPSNPQKNFIVKQGRILRLRQSRENKVKPPPQQQPCFVQSTSQYIKTKQEYLKRSPFSQSDFYDIDRQLVVNRHSLYRKMNVALRRSNLGCDPQPQNPFKRRNYSYGHSRPFDKDKNLTQLIYQVQPYWIKKHINKTMPNNG